MYTRTRQSLRGLSGPVFKNTAGQPIDKIVCGQPYTFDVPGYTRVWLRQYKNGQMHFDGIFPVPMPSYMADCVKDVGTYDNQVGEVASSGGVDNAMGARIGEVTFQVLPAGTAQTTVPPPAPYNQPNINAPSQGEGTAITLTSKGRVTQTPVSPVTPFTPIDDVAHFPNDDGGGVTIDDMPHGGDSAMMGIIPIAAVAAILFFVTRRH